jgi:hypothetical protein
MADSSITALRGTLVSFTADPFLVDPAKAYLHVADGLIVCRDGVIETVGPYDLLRDTLPADAPITDYFGCILCPGFIDTHVHYVQSEIIAAPGKQLLQWVEDYIYPVEEAFADEAPCAPGRRFLLRGAAPQRHDHALRLLRRLSAVGRRSVCRSLAAQHAGDRRQMHDGQERAGGAARHR